MMNWAGVVLQKLDFRLVHYRFFSAAIYFAAFACFFLFIKRLFGTTTAASALLFMVFLSPVWRSGVTQIYNFGDLVLWGGLLIILQVQHIDWPRRLLLTAALSFLMASVTYEFVICMALLIAALETRKGRLDGFLSLLASGLGAALAIIVKTVLDGYDRGSVFDAINQQAGRLAYRTLDQDGQNSVIDKLIGGIEHYPVFILKSYSNHYMHPALIIALLITTFAIAVALEKLPIMRKRFYFAAILAVGCFGWAFVFLQHTVVHVNSIVIRHWIYPTAFVFAIGISVLATSQQDFVRCLREKKWIAIIVFCHVLVLYGIVGETKSRLERFFKHAQTVTWATEVEKVRGVCREKEGDICHLPDKTLLRAAFLHQNAEFSLGSERFMVIDNE